MKSLTNILKSKKHLLGAIAVLFLAVGVVYGLINTDPETKQSQSTPSSIVEDVQDVEKVKLAETSQSSLYVCPMMCVEPSHKPGKCPICGMDLVPAGGEDKAGFSRLELSPQAVKLAGIQMVPVERKFVSAEVRLFGQIEYDPTHISYASVYVPGVIDRIYVKRAGQTVRWGDPLFDIYSPEIFYIEQQMLTALKVVPGYYALNINKPHIRKRANVLTGRPITIDADKASPKVKAAYETLNAMRHKLTLLGMEKKDIDEVMKRGEPTGIATIYAQRSGIVIEQDAYEGTYVNTGTPVFAIASPKFVWAKLDAYESDYAWIRMGQEVHFRTDTYPGETFKGKVVYVDPIFNTKTRTFSVGVIFADKGGRFRPNMYVRAVILAKLTSKGKITNQADELKQAPLVIPASAPLITGRRAVVYVAVPEKKGVFEGREVILGPRAKDHYVVIEGLKAGENVVTSGNFKIDSQVQILAKSSMMSIEGEQPADAHHHHGGSTLMEKDFRSRRDKRHSEITTPTDHRDSSMSSVTRKRNPIQLPKQME